MSEQLTDWRHWIKGLLAASVSAGASAISGMIVDPNQFNLSTGLGQIGKLVAINALVGAALYLKQSPLPQEKVE